jgi:hypothetical protein
MYNWLRTHEDFLEQYARAKEEALDMLAEKILDIADDTSHDWVKRNGRYVVNHENIQRARLRIDSRKWLLSKLAPKKYGGWLRAS